MTLLIVLLTVMIIILVALSILYGLYRKIHQTFFERRQPTSKLPYALSYREYENILKREEFIIDPDKSDFLKGYFYRLPASETYKGLIIVAHGFQADHTKYLPEIQLFAEAGYLVYAYDNLGNGESGGQSQVSLCHSAIDLSRVINAIQKTDYQTLPLGLYGHSWGGFAVLAVNSFNSGIKAVCARSGFEKESQTILDGLYKFQPVLTALLRPWAGLFAYLIDGKNSRIKASDGVKKAPETRFLLFHGQADRLVRFRHSAAYALLKNPRPNAKVLISPKGGHSLLYRQSSKKCRQAAKKEYEDLNQKYGEKWPEAVAATYRKQFPWSELYATEPEITAAILDFFEQNLV